MSVSLEAAVSEACRKVHNDRTRLMDIVTALQAQFGCVSEEAMNLIARELAIHRVEVESVVSFYAFLSERPKDLVGLSIPGMPTGVPGMEGPKEGPIKVYAIQKDGTTSTYAEQ